MHTQQNVNVISKPGHIHARNTCVQTHNAHTTERQFYQQAYAPNTCVQTHNAHTTERHFYQQAYARTTCVKTHNAHTTHTQRTHNRT